MPSMINNWRRSSPGSAGSMNCVLEQSRVLLPPSSLRLFLPVSAYSTNCANALMGAIRVRCADCPSS